MGRVILFSYISMKNVLKLNIYLEEKNCIDVIKHTNCVYY